jgi:hypothetical protein
MVSIDELLEGVDAAIMAHQAGKSAPFSAPLLRAVRKELEQMKISAAFDPTFARFVLDWPDASSELGKGLVGIAYDRRKALNRRV